MHSEQPKSLTSCRRFFEDFANSKHRQYEALRAFFLDGRPSAEVARAFGYSPGSFRVLCHAFRRDPDPQFFVQPQPGPKVQPKKSQARDHIISLRKLNLSVYEISEALKDLDMALSPTAVNEVLKAEGFAALPRRLDHERPARARPTVEPVADARAFSLEPRKFVTHCGGLLLFVPELVRLGMDDLATRADLPGSQMIPPAHALRACLALKLWSIERKSHIMALVADEGLGLFAGLPAIPKKSFLSEYSSRIGPDRTQSLLDGWQQTIVGSPALDGRSFNLDFHSVPFFGEHPLVERHYVAMRSRRQPSVLVMLAQDAETRAFCYSSADIRKGEEPDEIFGFVAAWKRNHGSLPKELVFDSRLTTYDNLARLDDMGIEFITLRRRSPKMLTEIANLPRTAWHKIELDVPTRKFRTPRVFEQTVTIQRHTFRQLYILDLGHDEPTILLTNKHTAKLPDLVTRYAQRMLIENALSDSVRFFHANALSSSVGLKVDFDMALLVIASGLYRLFAHKMSGYRDAQARQIFRDLIDMPADVSVTPNEVLVQFHRRAHLPILIESRILDKPVQVPWWNGATLRFVA
jgi:hypothetical protein